MEGQDLNARLSTEIARADLKLRPAEFVAAWIASPFVFAVVAFAVGIIFPGFRNVVALAGILPDRSLLPALVRGVPTAKATGRIQQTAA